MSTDLEVDDSSKSLVASWFGIKSLERTLDEKQFNRDEENSKKKRKKNDTKKVATEDIPQKKTELQVFSLGIPQKKTMSTFVGEKLQKKLKKLKHRKENSDKDIKEKTTQSDKVKTISTGRNQPKPHPNQNDDDECSKVKMIEKSKKTPAALKYTIESLEKKLNDSADLSKSQKKRLKKKLNLLNQKEDEGFTALKKTDVLEETKNNKAEKESKIKQTNETKILTIPNGRNKKTEKQMEISKSIDKNAEKGKSKLKKGKIATAYKEKEIMLELADRKDVKKVKKKKKDKDKEECLNCNEVEISDTSINHGNENNKKRKHHAKLDDSTISNISITEDIAVIPSPEKKVKTSLNRNKMNDNIKVDKKQDVVSKKKQKQKKKKLNGITGSLDSSTSSLSLAYDINSVKPSMKTNIDIDNEKNSEESKNNLELAEREDDKKVKSKKKKKHKDDYLNSDEAEISGTCNDSGKGNKKKRKHHAKLDDSTISNISITEDIAVIPSPEKKVKTSLNSNKKCKMNEYINVDKKQDVSKKKLKQKKKKLNGITGLVDLSTNSSSSASESEIRAVKHSVEVVKNVEDKHKKKVKVKNYEKTNSDYQEDSSFHQSIMDEMSESLNSESSPKTHKSEEDIKPSPLGQDEDFKKKRKKHKTRSKQKNIRKDHRPEHMKPAYLQQSQKDINEEVNK